MTQEDDLPARIHEWLRHEGYPFEMRVAQAFRKVGFHVTQSDYYTDPETQKPREIDVVAVAQRAEKDGPVFRIMFLIECKSSTKPLCLPKMLSGANAFKISPYKKPKMEASLVRGLECNNVTLRRKPLDGIFAHHRMKNSTS